MTPAATIATAAMATTTERGRRRPSARWVYGGTLGAFLAVFGGLATGSDEPAAEPVAAKPREVVVRRVITRVVVHHDAPVRRSPSPAAVRPAAAAPAPAPAPAPLTTQSS
jgi:hypothetical protein